MSQPEPTQAFQGYQFAKANFIQLPAEILWDTKDLAPELHHTLICAAGKILWEHFRTGVSRDTRIPIPLRWWTETLGLSPNAVRTRLARLEQLGRLVIEPNPDPHSGNLYGIRWAAKNAVTSFHAQRLAYRTIDLHRLKKRAAGTPLQLTEGGEPLQSTEPPSPSVDVTPPPSVDGPPTNKNVLDTDLNNPYPSVRPSLSPTSTEDLRTDGRMAQLLRKEAEGLQLEVLQALSGLLDPPQVAQIQASGVLGTKGLWALLESIRIHGKKLNSPAGVFWNATRDAQRAETWILRVLGPLEAAGWVEDPADGTGAETLTRLRELKALGEIRLIPLDQAGIQRRSEIRASVNKRAEERAEEWARQIAAAEDGDLDFPEEDQAEEGQEEPMEGLPEPPKPPVAVRVVDFPQDLRQRLPGLFAAWRSEDRKAWTAKPEEREAILAASREAFDRITAELAAVAPRIRAGDEVFEPLALTRKNINDIEKELSRD